MKESIEAMLLDFIVDNNIATDDEVRLVSDINGWNEETMTDIIYARTGLRSYEQCKDEGYSGTDELDSYYCLVLILVVLDDALVLDRAKAYIDYVLSCLNPCCAGRCPSTRQDRLLFNRFSKVLILVVLDDALVQLLRKFLSI